MYSAGGGLTNLYATPSDKGATPKVPISLYTTPGFAPESRVITAGRKVYGLVAIDSSRYGRLYAAVTGVDKGDTLEIYNTTTNPPSKTSYVLTVEDEEKLTGPAHIAYDGQYILIVLNAGRVRIFDLHRSELTYGAVPVPDDVNFALPDEEWVAANWLSGYFVLAARGGQIFTSESAQGASFRQLDFANAIARGDDIQTLAVIGLQMFVFGTYTIERWTDIGGADFPLARDNNLVLEIGTLAAASVVVNDIAVFFVGSDGNVYVLNGASPTRISTSTIESLIADANPSDISAYSYTEQGHRFYALSIGDKCYVFDLNTSLWHERTDGADKIDAICESLEGDSPSGRYSLVGSSKKPGLWKMKRDYVTTLDNIATERIAIAEVTHNNRSRVSVTSFEAEVGTDVPVTANLLWDNTQRASRLGIVSNTGRLKWTRLGIFRSRNYELRLQAAGQFIVLGAYLQFTPSET